jgi:hypothetical protein
MRRALLLTRDSKLKTKIPLHPQHDVHKQNEVIMRG